MAYFGKEFKFEREENCEGLLEALEKASSSSTNFLKLRSSQSLIKNGDDDYTLIINLPNMKKELRFKNGATIEDRFTAELVAQSTFTVDGDVFTQVMDFGAKGTLTFKREFTADSLKVTLTSSRWDGVAVRYYVPA